jgi:hypothetical protein
MSQYKKYDHVVGTSPGLQDLQDWTLVDELSGGSESLELTDGQYIYATAQCRNGIYLSEFATSKPTRVAAGAPNVTAAQFEVMVLSRSGYHAWDGFTYMSSEVHVFFEGIVDIVGGYYFFSLFNYNIVIHLFKCLLSYTATCSWYF